jgi:hypothetical protein
MPSPGADASGWEDAVLAALRCPQTQGNSLALSLWAQSEGMPAWANNWLATTKGGYGGTKFNSAGVWAYPTFAAGVAATAATIRQSNMQPILAALQPGNTPLSLIYQVINASPWCHGCQHGHYPVAMYDYLLGVVGGKPAPGVLGGFPVQGPSQPADFDWSATIGKTATAVSARLARIQGYASGFKRL